MASTQAQKKASIKYATANTTRLGLAWNNKTDADIIAKLNEQESKQGYIKALIRADIAKANK